MLTFLKKFNYIYVSKTAETQQVDKILSKKILQHLQLFFKMKPTGTDTYKKKNKTRNNKTIHNKTLKYGKY
jgi:phosphoribosylanthranilate isomerase